MKPKLIHTLLFLSLAYPSFAQDTPAPDKIPVQDIRGQFFADVFWQSLYATNLASSRLFPTYSLSSALNQYEISAGVLGLYTHQNDPRKQPSFTMHSKGIYGLYSFKTAAGHKTGLSLSVQQATAKDRFHNRVNSKYVALSHFLEIYQLQEKMIIALHHTFSFSNHHLNPISRKDKPTLGACDGHFIGKTMIGELSLYCPLRISSLTFTPFIGCAASASFQSDFQEQGTEARKFDTGDLPLCNFTLPIGIHNAFTFGNENVSSKWSLISTYKPTIFRHDAKVHSTFLRTQTEWLSSPTEVSLQSVEVQIQNETTLWQSLSLNFNYRCDLSSSTRSHYLLSNGKFIF